MLLYFAQLKSSKEKFFFSDPVFLIYFDFPKLPILENDKNYIFVFSAMSFPEASHVFQKKENFFQLDGEGSYQLPSDFEKYFSDEVKNIYFFLEPIKEDTYGWFKLLY